MDGIIAGLHGPPTGWAPESFPPLYSALFTKGIFFILKASALN